MGNRNTEKKKRQRQRRNQRAGRLNRGPARLPPAVNNRDKGKRGPNRPRITQTEGGATTVVFYEELWKSGLAKGITNCVFTPGTSGLTKLDQFASNWDEYWVESACVRYATSSGTVTSGHLYMGIDYSAKDLAQSTADVTSLDPRCDGPVWENQELVVNPKLAMKKPKMATESSDPDNTAFACSIANEVDNAGVVWCCYRVHFASPKRDESANSDILAQATTDIVVVSTQSVEPNGAPKVDIERPDDVTEVVMKVDPAAKAVETDFTVDQAQSAGSQFVISSPMSPESSRRLRNANGSGFKVVFTDAATGRVLPDTVVKQVTAPSADNGAVLAAVWEFVKPWVKTFVIGVVETFLGPNGNEAGDVRHVLSHRRIGEVPVEDYPGRDLSKSCLIEWVRQNAQYAWETSVDASVPGGPSGYRPADAQDDIFRLYQRAIEGHLDCTMYIVGQYFTSATDNPVTAVTITPIHNARWTPDPQYSGLIFGGWVTPVPGVDNSQVILNIQPATSATAVVAPGDRMRFSATNVGITQQVERVPFDI